MRTLFAFAAFVLLSSSQLIAQVVEPPRGASPRVLAPGEPSPRGAASRGAPAPAGASRGAAGAAAQGTAAAPLPGVYLVTFRPGTPAADRATVVQGHGARMRAAYSNIENVVTVDVPDAAVLGRLRNDPRVLGVFANQKIFIDAQGRGGGSGKPKPPESLTAVAASSNLINLSWTDASNNEDGFAIERCAGSNCGNFSEIFRTGPNVVAFADSGRTPQTVYRYRVLSFNTAGDSKYSNIANATTLPPPPPAAPSGLTATPSSHIQVNLSWTDNSTSEDGFRIERCTGSGCTSFSEIASVGPNTTAYSDGGRSPVTDYRYRVLAYNAGGNSAYSGIVGATTLPPPPPAAPSGLTATPSSHIQVDLSWTDNSASEDGFRIERCTGSGCTSFAEIAALGPNTTAYSDAGRSPMTDYRYRVLAYNAGGNSAFSDIASATTLAPPPPAAPSGLTATPTSHTQIDLSWTDSSSSEDGFRIERCMGTGCTSFAEIAALGPNTTAYSDAGRSPMTDYRYRVLAFNAGGNSAYSNIANATTLPPPPPAAPSGLTATPGSHTQVNLSWTDNSSSEDGFRIERCVGAGCTSFAEIVAVGPNVVTYSDAGLSPSTDYRYRMVAFNAGGNSAYSSIATATTPVAPPPPPPTAPSGLTATPVSHNQVNLSWTDNSSSEDGFRIERCLPAGCTTFMEIVAVGPNVVTYSDSGLTPSMDYRYRVVAYNAGGNSPYTNIANATTLPPPPPAAPSGLTATPSSHTQVDLSWTDNSSGEEGFRIERCMTAGCTDFAEIAAVGPNMTTYSDAGRSPSTDYRYRVAAFNAGGNSSYSNMANATTLAPPAPTAPSGLTATPSSHTQVDLSWTDNSNSEDGFRIERCMTAGCTNFAEIAAVGPNTTTYSDAGRSPSTDYRYRVAAYNAGGSSAYSNIANATTLPLPPPAAPSGLTATPSSHTQVNLSWSDNSNSEDGFRIERCMGAGCTSFAEIAAVGPNVLTYSDAGRSPSTAYRYRVLAYNAGGNSAYSNIANATTLPLPPPAAPSGLTATPSSHIQVDLSWTDNSSSEDGFRIERCMGAGCTSFAEVVSLGPNVLSYSDAGRSPSTDYRYRVLAFNAGGNSAYSNIANVTTPATPPPAAPSNLTATAISYSHVEMSWSDNSNNESGFRIERCTGPMASCTSFVQIAQVTFDITALSELGLQGQTTYTYRVRAFNASGQSAYSNSAQVTTPTAPPSSQVVPAGVQRIGAAPGALSRTGAGVGVAVIDTGLDFLHEDLLLQTEVPGTNSYHAAAPGTTCQDIHGHGTHVAGIIGAKNNLIDVVGVAPNSTIYCVNVFEPDPVEGVSATDESVIAGLNWVLTHATTVSPRIRVVNMSLGRPREFQDDDSNHPLRVAVRALYNAGISVVVAAGNDPQTEVIDQVPAFYPEVMAVASTTAEDGVNGYDTDFPACVGLQPIKADSASYFTTDGRFLSGTGVTISAPGGTREDLFDFGGTCFQEPIGILSLQAGGGTVENSGTSMASPHVAGVVALMWEKELSLGSTLPPETARTRIRNNAIRRGTAPLDSPIEEYTYDGEREGVIWAPSALLDAPPPPVDAPPTVTIVSPINSSNFPTGASIAFTGTATDPEDGNIAASLAWASSRDGSIGTGASFNRTLSNGNHIITTSVVDSAGNARSASVSISVGSASTPTTVHAASVTYTMVGSTLRYTVKLANEFGGPVAGATIRVSLYEWVYTGFVWFANGVTDSQGNAQFQLLNADYGCYTTGIENVVAPGLTWIPGNPNNNYCRL